MHPTDYIETGTQIRAPAYPSLEVFTDMKLNEYRGHNT